MSNEKGMTDMPRIHVLRLLAAILHGLSDDLLNDFAPSLSTQSLRAICADGEARLGAYLLSTPKSELSGVARAMKARLDAGESSRQRAN